MINSEHFKTVGFREWIYVSFSLETVFQYLIHSNNIPEVDLEGSPSSSDKTISGSVKFRVLILSEISLRVFE